MVGTEASDEVADEGGGGERRPPLRWASTSDSKFHANKSRRTTASSSMGTVVEVVLPSPLRVASPPETAAEGRLRRSFRGALPLSELAAEPTELLEVSGGTCALSLDVFGAFVELLGAREGRVKAEELDGGGGGGSSKLESFAKLETGAGGTPAFSLEIPFGAERAFLDILRGLGARVQKHADIQSYI